MGFTDDDIIEIFKQKRAQFKSLAESYGNKPDETFNKLNGHVVREELCVGSDIFLGFYCPSPVYDLIVGNTHRGKILKRITKRSVITHRYGFDKEDRLITIKDYNNNCECFFEYRSNIVFIICFRNHQVEYIAECEYNNEGHIVTYTLGSYISKNKVDVIEQEIYTYDACGIDTVIMWDCSSISNSVIKAFESFEEKSATEKLKQTGCIVRIDAYKLRHNSEGFVTGYETIGNDFWDGTVFEIAKSKQRKI